MKILLIVMNSIIIFVLAILYECSLDLFVEKFTISTFLICTLIGLGFGTSISNLIDIINHKK